MTRLFLPAEMLSEEKIVITGEQARYLSLVLRIRPGNRLIIFDGSTYKYICKVLHVHKKEITAVMVNKEPYTAESPLSITLAQGLPKSDRMDLIIQKSTELGVKKIVPLITGRSQVRHTAKTDRWRKIALAASQQCGREKITGIDDPVEFEKFLYNPPFPLFSGIIFSEEQKEQNLKRILAGLKDVENIVLLIGPEGGFSEEETEAAVGKGFITASLGPRILRTETAPLSAISIIQYELGDMG
ncbi:MAG: 16S rRNA (uracil(1498)-N(3))-methyltransferase [Nitrospiraceae bacterium]|nr:MAG: 16S rRNA (uracil(1498)-N(3))-methyltransferase [Nitrospiraceae bacterium]